MHDGSKRVALLAIVLLFGAGAGHAQDSTGTSIKEDFKEIGRAISRTSKDVYDKTKNATTHGVGTALEKTGEGFDKAADGLGHAGEKVKESGTDTEK